MNKTSTLIEIRDVSIRLSRAVHARKCMVVDYIVHCGGAICLILAMIAPSIDFNRVKMVFRSFKVIQR